MVNEQPNAIKEATVAKKVNGKATAEKVVKVTTAKERRMKKSRFAEAPVPFAFQQAERGTPVAEFISKLGISEQT